MIPAHTAWTSRRTHNLPHDVLEGGWNHLIAMSSCVPARRGQCLWSPRKSAAFLNPPCRLFSSLALWLSLSLPAPEHLHPELFCFSFPFIISPSLSLFYSLPPLLSLSPPSLALHIFAPRSLLSFLFLALPHDSLPSHLLHHRCPPTVAASVSPCCDSPSPPAQDPSNRRLTLINCLAAEPVCTVPPAPPRPATRDKP